MIIGGLQKTSLLDYPAKICAIVFTQGCNFRCAYCHNPELLVQKEPSVSEEAFFEFLKTRQGKLDGVVITGGEPCLMPDLKSFIEKIKQLGFLVKLDTNGSFPDVLEELISENLLDYIAMDIKAPFDKYETVTCVKTDIDSINRSVELIKNSGVAHEFRTTVLPCFLGEEDIMKMSSYVNGSTYKLQQFVPTKILDESLLTAKVYTEEQLNKFRNNIA